MDKTYLETTNNPNKVAVATINTPTVVQTPAFDFNAEVQNSLARAKAKESTVITADTLTPSSSPVIPPPTNTNTALNNLKSNLSATTPTPEELTQQSKAQEVNPLSKTASRIEQIAGIQANQGQDTVNAQNEAGLSPARQKLNEVNASLLRLQNEYDKEVERIQKNPEGKFGGALTQDLRDAEARYLDKKADLNIDALVAQGNVDTALKLVEDKIKAKYEPLDNELKTLQTLYGLYQNDMTESEKLLAQQAYQEKSNKLDFDRQKELLDYKTNIKTQQKTQEIANSGLYTPKQLSALTKLNESVSKSDTYKKTNNMRGYVDNVTASLSQETGVGDLAAINQFQKVIDEGAVTRDQDVKLIQSSQSLANKLNTYVSKLSKGEQLSPQLRTEMRTAVQKLYEAQVNALSKDPYIQSKTREAKLYGLDPVDTVLGELGTFSTGESTSNPFASALGGTTLEEFTIYNPSQGFLIPTE